MLDRTLVSHAIRCDEQFKLSHLEQARSVTGLENPNSPAQLKAWLADKGVEAESISKEAKQNVAFRPVVYICSPLSGDIPGNQEKARRYCRFAVDCGYIPLAPHPDTYELAQHRIAQNTEKCNIKKPTTARYPFSGKIVCGCCGKHFGRKTTHGRVSWICMTFQFEGKSACPAKQIPEPTLISACCDVLGIAEFDERGFTEKISGIRVTAPNELLFLLADGHTETRVWKDRSRSDSWTDEMKQAARQRAAKKRRDLRNEQ